MKSVRRFAVGMMVIGILAGLQSSQAKQTKAGDKTEYRQMIEKRAQEARKHGDVKAMIETAFALYPLEAAKQPENPQYLKLLKAAANTTLATKDRKKAQGFLELCGPLASALPEKKRREINKLALGKPLEREVKERAERARGPLKKAAPDLADPDVKVRGATAAIPGVMAGGW